MTNPEPKTAAQLIEALKYKPTGITEGCHKCWEWLERDIAQAIEAAEKRGREAEQALYAENLAKNYKRGFEQGMINSYNPGNSSGYSHMSGIIWRLMKRFNLEPGKAGYIEKEIDKAIEEAESRGRQQAYEHMAEIKKGCVTLTHGIYEQITAEASVLAGALQYAPHGPNCQTRGLQYTVHKLLVCNCFKSTINLSPATQAAMAVIEAAIAVHSDYARDETQKECSAAVLELYDAVTEYERVMSNE